MSPVPKGTRYRYKTTKGGKKIRLAFAPNGKVVETKTLAQVLAKNKRKRKARARRRK